MFPFQFQFESDCNWTYWTGFYTPAAALCHSAPNLIRSGGEQVQEIPQRESCLFNCSITTSGGGAAEFLFLIPFVMHSLDEGKYCEYLLVVFIVRYSS